MEFEVLGAPREVLAYALMPDGTRKVIDGWIVRDTMRLRRDGMTLEILKDAIAEQAKYMGADGFEICLTDIG